MAKNSFVFNTPGGNRVGEARDVGEFKKLMRDVPMESLKFHFERGDFVKWLMHRREPGLAARVRAIKASSWDLRGDLVYALDAPHPKPTKRTAKKKPSRKKAKPKKKPAKKKAAKKSPRKK
jgi:hypothetical protein